MRGELGTRLRALQLLNGGRSVSDVFGRPCQVDAQGQTGRARREGMGHVDARHRHLAGHSLHHPSRPVSFRKRGLAPHVRCQPPLILNAPPRRSPAHPSVPNVGTLIVL